MEMKEENALSREFTLALTDDAEGLQFAVIGFPMSPFLAHKTVLWVRARDRGGEWGQSAYVEAFRQNPNEIDERMTWLYLSNVILLGTLWLEPGKVYTVEVTSEGLEVPQLEVRCVRRAPPPPKAIPAVPTGESASDNPVLWLALLVVAFALAMLLVIR